MPSTKTLDPSAVERASYVRCPLCRQKFQKDVVDILQLQKQGCPDCLKRKEGKSNVLNVKITNAQTSSSSCAPSKRGDLAVFSSGAWTQKCDQCEKVIKLGNGNNQSAFESHRNSRGCQEKRHALKERRRLERQRSHFSDYIIRNPSQKDGQDSSKNVQINADDFLPISLTEQNNIGANKELEAWDANTATLARDLLRALADVTTERKRKNDKEHERSKKPKMN